MNKTFTVTAEIKNYYKRGEFKGKSALVRAEVDAETDSEAFGIFLKNLDFEDLDNILMDTVKISESSYFDPAWIHD